MNNNDLIVLFNNIIDDYKLSTKELELFMEVIKFRLDDPIIEQGEEVETVNI